MYYTFALTGDPDPPYPSLADAGYLSIYPAAYVGLVLLLRARAPRLGSALWLDGLVCALAGAAIGAALVLGLVAEHRRLVRGRRDQPRLSARATSRCSRSRSR